MGPVYDKLRISQNSRAGAGQVASQAAAGLDEVRVIGWEAIRGVSSNEAMFSRLVHGVSETVLLHLSSP